MKIVAVLASLMFAVVAFAGTTAPTTKEVNAQVEGAKATGKKVAEGEKEEKGKKKEHKKKEKKGDKKADMAAPAAPATPPAPPAPPAAAPNH